MELVGEEKKIQALFSELKLADESITPPFAVVWNRAHSRTLSPHRAFNFSFVVATALVVLTLASLAWWSRSWQRNSQPNAVVTTTPGPRTSPELAAPNRKSTGIGATTEPHRFSAQRRSVRAAARRQAEVLAANQLATSEALALSKWTSPTSALLNSSSGEIITSLPQLNENANELKSFLPGPDNQQKEK